MSCTTIWAMDGFHYFSCKKLKEFIFLVFSCVLSTSGRFTKSPRNLKVSPIVCTKKKKYIISTYIHTHIYIYIQVWYIYNYLWIHISIGKHMGVNPKIVELPQNHPWITRVFPWFSPSILGCFPLHHRETSWLQTAPRTHQRRSRPRAGAPGAVGPWVWQRDPALKWRMKLWCYIMIYIYIIEIFFLIIICCGYICTYLLCI